MKITVGGHHEYSIEWIASLAGLFLACVWVLVTFLFKSGHLQAVDFIPVIIIFCIGFSAVELLGAWEIYKLWRDENDALRAEAWRRYWEERKIGEGYRDGIPVKIELPEDENYLETGIPINGGRDGYIVTQRPLTLSERLWGEYLETLALHAAHRESYKTKALLGEVVSQPDALTKAKRFLHEMGLIYNVNGDAHGARPIRSFAYVVEEIPNRLSRVKFPDAPPPPIPPAPPESLEILPKSRIKVKGQ